MRARGKESTRGTKLPFLIYTQIRTLDCIFIIPLLFLPGKSSPRLSHQLLSCVILSLSHSRLTWLHKCRVLALSPSRSCSVYQMRVSSHFTLLFHPVVCHSVSLYISLYTSLLLVFHLALWAAGRSVGLSEEKRRFK